MKKEKLKVCSLVILSLLICLTMFTGCRKTTKIEQIVFTDKAEEIDYDQYKYELENNAELDEQLKQTEETQKEQDQQEQTDAVEGEDENQADHVSDLEYNSDSTVDATGASGTDSNADGTPENPTGSDSDYDGDNSSPKLNPTNDSTSLRQVMDANGNVVKIPENVDYVSAVGNVADYVEMLGGKGRLVATSADFSETSFTSKVFGESVQTLWDGSGSSAMSDAQFNKLIAAGPQVCLIENGSITLSDSQISKLNSAGIYVVTVPKLNTSKNIKNAVTLLGKILGDKSSKGGEDAVANAEAYNKWFDSIVSKLSSSCSRYALNNVDYDNDRSVSKTKYISGSNNPMYALYVSDWDSSASYKVFNSAKGTAMSGSGAPATVSGYSSSPMSYFMSLAGVGSVSAGYDDFGTEKEWYVNGLLKGDFAITINGKYTDYTAGDASSPYLSMVVNSDNSQVYLGSDMYKNVIAATKDIKKNIENSALMKVYGIVTTSKGSVNGFQLSGNYVGSVITGDYTITVNPHGASSWTTGSPEAPLEGLWISATYGTGVSESDLKSEIKNFYKEFYRYDLSDSQVSAILAGI